MKTKSTRRTKTTPRTTGSRSKAPKKTGKKAVSSKTTSKKRKKAAPVRAKRKPVSPPPAPPARRAVFIDVENTSSEEELIKVFDHLEVDQKLHPTEITGIGNWKALGSRFARTLGRYGAQLVHTAPMTGVRDWSDLWIAVNVGRWLARANAGDLLDIVSDDRAFDAIGDAAAAVGVHFRRISYHGVSGRTVREVEPAERPRRNRRRRRKSANSATTPETIVHIAPAERDDVAIDEDASHAASEEQIRLTLARLAGEVGGWVNLDALANTLRSEGFTRPPGSPRLMTRLRRMKDVEVLPNGTLRLLGAAGSDS